MYEDSEIYTHILNTPNNKFFIFLSCQKFFSAIQKLACRINISREFS